MIQSSQMANLAGHWICASCRRSQTRVPRRSFAALTPSRKHTPNARLQQITQRRDESTVGREHERHSTRQKHLDLTDPRDGEIIKHLVLPNTKPREYGAWRPVLKANLGRQGGKIPDFPARTRFAPSPTGYMHFGGLRTALYSYLLAKKTQGQFILRIEDTDQSRLVQDAEERICDHLRWAGLQWDEGPGVGGEYGPYKQSERKHIYHQHAQQLLDSGAAYRCFCPLQTAPATPNMGAAITHSGCFQDCASLSRDQAEERAVDGNKKHTIRLRPDPVARALVCRDLTYGVIERLRRTPGPGGESPDPILIKTDGMPTYHFANVIDDHLMEITHVIRGNEWTASTHLHVELYHAFGWTPPLFAHVGLLVDEDQSKLSKRTNSGITLDIERMRSDQGLLPETLTNFLALLGWGNPNRSDFLSMSDLIESFDLKFTKGNAVVQLPKLWFLQKSHVFKRTEASQTTGSIEPLRPIIEVIEKEVLSLFSASEIHTRGVPLQEYIADILHNDAKGFHNARQYTERNRYFFTFDRAQVPLSAGYGSEDPLPSLINATSVETFVADFLKNYDFHQPFVPSNFWEEPQDPLAVDPSRLVNVRWKIHAGLHQLISRALLKPEKKAELEGEIGLVKIRSNPYKDTALNGLAEFVAGSWESETVTSEMIQEQHKKFYRQISSYLRKILAYNLPGPGTTGSMAVLGWEECCRRLEIDLSGAKGNGW